LGRVNNYPGFEKRGNLALITRPPSTSIRRWKIKIRDER
jgi:hypothetical protein